jgi:hypothetical protein
VGVYAQLQVALIVGGASVFPGDVAVIADPVTVKWVAADMTVDSLGEGRLVFSCYGHVFGLPEDAVDSFKFVLYCFQEVLDRVFSVV